MATETLDLPAEMPRTLGDPDSAVREREAVVRELRLAAALYFYEHGRVGGERAAELAGISRADFIEACGRAGIASVRYSPDELDTDYAALRLNRPSSE